MCVTRLHAGAGHWSIWMMGTASPSMNRSTTLRLPQTWEGMRRALLDRVSMFAMCLTSLPWPWMLHVAHQLFCSLLQPRPPWTPVY